MAEEFSIEIYKQRYDTYRHLDKLRWQMLQIAVGVGTVGTAVITAKDDSVNWWVVMAISGILMLLGFIMVRMQHGITKNGHVLRKVGINIGDVDLPIPTGFWRSRSNWVAFFVIFIGLICFLVSLNALIPTFC